MYQKYYIRICHIDFSSVDSIADKKCPKINIDSEKGRDLTRSYNKSPYTDRKIQKAKWQHKNAIKNFYYTTIADRLRKVSWSNSSFPTGVVKPFYGIPTFPLTAKAV